MTIDADGAPNAYHPDNIGLDDLKHAGYPDKSWWKSVLVEDPQKKGFPFIQKDGLTQGYYISKTALFDRKAATTDPGRYVDASQIPYLVFPKAFYRIKGTGYLGDYGIAYHPESGRQCPFIVADIGPSKSPLGEVSIRLAENLSQKTVNARNGRGRPKGRVLYLIFPGSRQKPAWPQTPLKIQNLVQQRLKTLPEMKKLHIMLNLKMIQK